MEKMGILIINNEEREINDYRISDDKITEWNNKVDVNGGIIDDTISNDTYEIPDFNRIGTLQPEQPTILFHPKMSRMFTTIVDCFSRVQYHIKTLYSAKVDKTTKIAGIDLKDDITVDELKDVVGIDNVNTSLTDQVERGYLEGNVWDEVIKSGYTINASTGAEVSNASMFVSSPIKVGANQKYYFAKNTSYNVSPMYCYDSNMNFLSYVGLTSNAFTTPNNCAYVKFFGVSTTYSKGTICVNRFDENINGKFLQYAPSNFEITNNALSIAENKILGWDAPKELYAKNTVEGNSFIQRIDRIKGDSLTFVYNGALTGGYGFTATLPGSVSVSNLDDKVRVFCKGVESISGAVSVGGGHPNSVALISNNRLYVVVPTNSADSAKALVSGKYVYFELATPITKTIDGNEAVTNINKSLGDYGMDNKFDGQLAQGYWKGDTYGTVVNSNYIRSVTMYPCNPNDLIKIKNKMSGLMRFEFIWFSSATTLSTTPNTRATSPFNEVEAKAPSDAHFFAFNIGSNDSITPTNASGIAIYQNNAIDKINADLCVLDVYTPTTAEVEASLPNGFTTANSVIIGFVSTNKYGADYQRSDENYHRVRMSSEYPNKIRVMALGGNFEGNEKCKCKVFVQRMHS